MCCEVLFRSVWVQSQLLIVYHKTAHIHNNNTKKEYMQEEKLKKED